MRRRDVVVIVSSFFSRRVARATLAVMLCAGMGAVQTACAGRSLNDGAALTAMPESDLEHRIERLERRIDRRPEDVRARRDLGHLLWLHAGDTEAAWPHLSAAADLGDLISRSSLLMIGRARLRHEGARKQALAILEAALSDDGWADTSPETAIAITEIALDDLLSRIGNRPLLDAELLPFLDTGRLSKRAPSLGVLASIGATNIALHAKSDPAEAVDARGCVRDWKVSELEGRLGAAELPTLSPQDPFRVVPSNSVLAAHRCGVRVWNATPVGGIRKLRAFVRNASDDLYMELVASQEYRFYVDGMLVAHNDLTDKWPRNDAHQWLRVPAGRHTLELHIAVPGAASTWMLNLFDGDGVPVEVEPPGDLEARMVPRGPDFRVERDGAIRLDKRLPSEIYAPWLALVRLSRQLGEGDYDQGEATAHLLETAKFAEAYLQLANFERNEPSRGGAASSTRLQGHLEAAVKLDPGVASARVQLLRLRLDRDEVTKVLDEVAGFSAQMRHLYEVEVLLADLYFQRDSDVQAARALQNAKRLAPDSCRVRRSELALVRRRSQSHREDELVAEYSSCDRNDERRADWARSRGDYRTALAITDKALAGQPDSMKLLGQKARDLVALGDLEGAHDVRELQLEYNPLAVNLATAYADLSFQLGFPGKGRAAVAKLLEKTPSQPGVLELAERVGLGMDPLLKHRLDGGAAINAYIPVADQYEGASDVLVLDRDVVWIHDDLSQRHLIHQIVSLHSKESLDTYGEMDVPDGGELLTMRTVKPDGRVVEPEVISGKSGVSLRDLEIGDFVELEYIIGRGPSSLLPGHIDLGGFRFQSTGTPFHRSELIVDMPGSLPYKVDARNDAPTPVVSTENGRKRLHFLAERMMRREPEPDARSLTDEMPTVRVFTSLDVLEWRRVTEANLRLTLRRNDELRRLVRTLVKGAADTDAKTRAIWKWAAENIESGGSMTGTITQTLAERSGNLMMLVMGMLDEAGIRTEIWLARSRLATPATEGGYPPMEEYAAPLLMVWTTDDGPPVALVPGSKVMPFGYHSAALERRAIRLRPGAPLGADALYGELPPIPESLTDRRAYDLDLRVNLDGEGRLSGTIQLSGVEAIQWRQALTRFDRDRLLEVFQQAELQRVIPGSTLSLETIEIEGEEDLDAPLVFRFAAEARGVGRQGAGEIELRNSIVPMNLAMQYARLPERWSELAVGYAPQVTARVRIEVEDGTLSSVPSRESLDGDFGRYGRYVTEGGVGRNFVIQEWSAGLKLRGIPAAEYPAFLEFSREVEALERQELRFTGATAD